MNNLNSNDYKILESIIDAEKNRGISRGRGSTLQQLIDKTGFSNVKIRNTIKALLELGLIEEGVKKVRAKTFYITEKGIDELKDLRKTVINLSNNI